jgi:hypothetical protein
VPEITAITEAQFVQDWAMDTADMGGLPLAYQEVLTLLGLATAGDLAADAQAQAVGKQVLALYDFDTQTITRLARGEIADAAEANVTLLHELVHAQQDAAHDLGALNDGAHIGRERRAAQLDRG